jgi:hypothetical protein
MHTFAVSNNLNIEKVSTIYIYNINDDDDEDDDDEDEDDDDDGCCFNQKNVQI